MTRAADSSSFSTLTLALACALLTCASCGDRSGSRGPRAVESDAGRFPHRTHAKVACIKCHAADAVRAGRPARPGADDHAPCDDSGCHRKEFLAKPGPLCKTCHTAVEPTRRGGTTLTPYPPTRGRRALAAEFAHRPHLDYGAMEKRVGFHVGCTDCHTFDKGGQLAPPDHAVCRRCHASEAAPPGAPVMSACATCHKPRTRPPTRLRRMIVGDLHFSHASHRTDRRGRLVRCTECHTETRATSKVGGHAQPATATCVTCHDDATRTPPTMRMRVCATCHTGRGGFSAIAPRSHLPPRDVPPDHTIAFRRDHGADARANSKRCAGCHTFMSRSRRDTCDECHQVMRPRDHVVGWREFEHGPAAATRSDACATCHVGSFCTACHARPPRSHFPLIEFRRGSHATLAKRNMRACVACHQIARDCSRCHTTRPR